MTVIVFLHSQHLVNFQNMFSYKLLNANFKNTLSKIGTLLLFVTILIIIMRFVINCLIGRYKAKYAKQPKIVNLLCINK